jgi:hypothetical protein
MKFMKLFLAICLAATVACGTVGCGKTTEVKKQTTVETPEGTTTTTQTETVEKTGENPPPAEGAGTTNP